MHVRNLNLNKRTNMDHRKHIKVQTPLWFPLDRALGLVVFVRSLDRSLAWSRGWLFLLVCLIACLLGGLFVGCLAGRCFVALLVCLVIWLFGCSFE